jgi:hypothetical protein
MDLKKLTLVTVVLTSIFAVGLVSVNFAEAAGPGIVFIKSSDRAMYGLSGGSGSGGGNTGNQGIGQ